MAEVDGLVTFEKRMLAADFLEEPANLRSALVDLWMLANDRDRTLKLNGREVNLKRGQLAWSLRSLAERWHWGVKKVEQVLRVFQEHGFIMLQTSPTCSVITVIDYALYNDDSTPCGHTEHHTEGNTESDTEHHTEGHTEHQQKGEVRSKKEKGEGGRRAHAGEADFLEVAVPSLEECLAWGEAAGVDGGWIERKYAYTEGTHGWERNGRLVDWRKLWLVWFHEDVRLKRYVPGRVVATEKNGEKTAGESKAQRLYKLDMRLQELAGLIASMEDLNPELYDQFTAEQKALQVERRELSGGVQ